MHHLPFSRARVYWATHGPRCHKDVVPPPLRVHDLGRVRLHGFYGPPPPPPRRIPTRHPFLDTWHDMAKPLELQPPMTMADPPGSGRSWPVHSWAGYIQSCLPRVDTFDWGRLLSFIVHGDVHPCAAGSWTRLCIGLFNHGNRGRTPAYL